jgi:esterase/lipase
MNTKNKISFQKKMLNPIFFKLFLILKLPLVFLAGVKLKSLTDTHSTIQLKYNYLNKNPFKSIYFAALSMAGELASGILAASFIYKNIPKISMLVVELKIEFSKKAVGLINFSCNQGKEIQDCINKSLATKEGQTIEIITTATDQEGDLVAIFNVKWSFKSK